MTIVGKNHSFSHVKSSISEKMAQKPRGCQLLGENWLETSSLSSLSRHRLSTIDELILSFSSSFLLGFWVAASLFYFQYIIEGKIPSDLHRSSQQAVKTQKWSLRRISGVVKKILGQDVKNWGN